MSEDIKIISEPNAGEEILGEDPEPEPTPEPAPEPIGEVPDPEPEPEPEPKPEEVEEEEEEEELELSPRDEDIVKKLNTKDKTILKEFPQIRSALYEQREFRKVFPSVDDAKEAADRSEILDILEDAATEGKPEVILTQIAETNPEAHKKFVSNFLPALFKQNPQLYDEVVAPLAKNMLYTAMQQGIKSGNQNLVKSAKHLNLFLFDTPEVTPGEVTKEDPKLLEDRTKFNNERANIFRTDVQKNAIAVMTSRIDKMIPKEVEGALRKVMLDSVLKGIGAQLNKDEYYGRQVASLYRKAAKSSYAGDWGPRIQSLYLGQATKLLPAVFGLASKELLGNRATPKPKLKVKVEAREVRAEDPKQIWKPDPKTGKKMSDLEFLAS